MSDTVSIDASNLEAMRAAKHYQAAMLALVQEALGLTAGPIADFGAGEGNYAAKLQAAMPQTKIVCVEPDSALTARYPATLEHVSQVDAIPPASLAAAYSLNVFEHIDEDASALAALATRIAPGGKLFILVPAHMSLWTAMDDAVGHKRRYTANSLFRLAQDAGLRVLSAGWFDQTGYLAAKATRLLERLGLPVTDNGRITARQVRTFDRLFALLEPILNKLTCLPGKNRWVLVEKPCGR